MSDARPIRWARGIAKDYGRRTVLAPRDIELQAGRSLAITGANGAGKTTLLRLLAGTLRPTRGEIGGGPVAYVAQEAPVYAAFTPLEEVQWLCSAYGSSKVDAAAIVADAGLASHATRPNSSLSRGQRQRLALAAAFASPAPCILLDEPDAALDEAGRAWLGTKINAACAAGRAVAFADHHGSLPRDETIRLDAFSGGRA